MNCVHCGRKFTCGCQKAKGKDGFTVCKTCLNTYNTKQNQRNMGRQTTKQPSTNAIRQNEINNRNDRATRANH